MEFFNHTYKFDGETVINDTPYNSPSISVNSCTVFAQGQKATLDIAIREAGALQPRWENISIDCTPQSDLTVDLENWLSSEIGEWTKTAN